MPATCPSCTRAPSSSSACQRYVDAFGSLHATSQYQPPPGLHWDDEKYSATRTAPTPGRSTSPKCRVDMTTWETRVDDFVAVQEVGRVINPVLAAGQIEGGVAQGIGWALYENVVWRDGRMANAQMTNYIMPTSMDLPPIRVFFEEMPYPYGPSGAKGIGELPMDGAAPGDLQRGRARDRRRRPTQLPLTPERLMDLMEAARWLTRTVRMTCVVNGRRIAFEAHPMARLLDVLRREARLTGTKEGCGEGECGACAVLLDGELVNSCLTPAGAGRRRHHHDDRRRRRRTTSCTPCRRRSSSAAARSAASARRAWCSRPSICCRESPSRPKRTSALRSAGNLCRCTGYMRIFESVLHACRQLPHGLASMIPLLDGYSLVTPAVAVATRWPMLAQRSRRAAVRRRHRSDGPARGRPSAAGRYVSLWDLPRAARHRGTPTASWRSAR